MTQKDLALKIHVTTQAVSKWERGIGLPDINTLEPLAAALDIEVDELMLTKRYSNLTDETQNNQTTAPLFDEQKEAVQKTIEIANDPKRKKSQYLLIPIGRIHQENQLII